MEKQRGLRITTWNGTALSSLSHRGNFWLTGNSKWNQVRDPVWDCLLDSQKLAELNAQNRVGIRSDINLGVKRGPSRRVAFPTVCL